MNKALTTLKPGNYMTYLQIGKNCFKDTLKLTNNSCSTTKSSFDLKIDRLRKKECYLVNKFDKYETNSLTFSPIDASNTRLGGLVEVTTSEYNFSEISANTYKQFGYFTDDKIVFAKFVNDVMNQEDILKENIEDASSIESRHVYQMNPDGFFEYKLENNPRFMENQGTSVSAELLPKKHTTWGEMFFYNL